MTTALPRLKSVKPTQAPYVIAVTWEDGRKEAVDFTGVVMREAAFEPLRDLAEFKRVKLAKWGWGIEWPNGLDYAPDTLARLAEAQRGMKAQDFVAWQEKLKLSNPEAADMLGRSLSSIKDYRSAKAPIPHSVAMTCRVLEHDRVMLSALYRPSAPAGRPKRAA
ncbi:MAG: DUF2442 domain-containing protein [Alphaproteobacteria bacterium]|nr:DUF2442 domain-containing protein [Alphaproteobacteria bacterium]